MSDFSLEEVKCLYVRVFNIHALGVLLEPPSEDLNASIVSLNTIVETNFKLWGMHPFTHDHT